MRGRGEEEEEDSDRENGGGQGHEQDAWEEAGNQWGAWGGKVG